MIKFKEYLVEIGNTVKGRDKLQKVSDREVDRLIRDTAADALNAAAPGKSKSSHSAVVGRNKDGSAIYQKEKPHQERKSTHIISRVAHILATRPIKSD